MHCFIFQIYVNPKRELSANSDYQVFGMADNAPDELARTVLVFQYISLFSKKR